MSRILLLGSLLALSPIALAQPNLHLGQTVTGTLSDGDPMLDDASYYHLYPFQGVVGQYIRVTLRSPDFDAFLGFGLMTDQGFEITEVSDDDGGGTDALLHLRLPATGTYGIRANSLAGGEQGAYTLSVEASEPITPIVPAQRPIAANETVHGMLEKGHGVAANGAYYDLYVYDGTAGETLTITLRSEDFDAFLVVRSCDTDEALASNDDVSGLETDAQLTLTLPEAGSYCIEAHTLSTNDSGAYTLALTTQ